MVQWDSLSWGQQQHLQAMYERENPRPAALSKYEDPKPGAAKVVQADGANVVFVGVPRERHHRPAEREALVRLTVQIGLDAHQVELVEEDAVLLFQELTRAIDEARRINRVRRARVQAEIEHNEAVQAWETVRDRVLIERLAKGDITKAQIEAAAELSDIPF